MPYSHHSHSGQFCNHATDQLERIVQEAIRQKMRVFALTEHMPRDREEDLYPGEVEIGWNLEKQASIFKDYYATARLLQAKYENRIAILVGMEIDWIRASSRQWIEFLISTYPFDLFVGSVHHVHGIPIDFDADSYSKALLMCSRRANERNVAREDVLFEDYFDAQLEMLQSLKPPVVGHFDLIRLMSSDRDANLRDRSDVWEKIKRNLAFIKDYGGALELNSAAFRKGLKEPYPNSEVCKAFCEMNGKFVFSDDSHGIGHIGHSYPKLLEHAKNAGIQAITILERNHITKDMRFPSIGTRDIPIQDVGTLDFWGN